MQYIQKFTLKQYRLLAGMTQDELAEALGVDRTTIAMWESGRLPSAFRHIAKLEELFDMKLADDFLMP